MIAPLAFSNVYFLTQAQVTLPYLGNHVIFMLFGFRDPNDSLVIWLMNADHDARHGR